MLNTIYQFFNHPLFVIFGGISVTIIVLLAVLNFIFWIFGIAPLLWRLGYSRWTRVIAIVAKNENLDNLKKDLEDSGIFRKNKITFFGSNHLSDVKKYNLLLIDYQSFNEDEINLILENKKSNAGMIFYFPGFSPQNGKSIPDEMRNKISNSPNTTIVNFRGRLLNDIVTTLITTSYKQ